MTVCTNVHALVWKQLAKSETTGYFPASGTNSRALTSDACLHVPHFYQFYLGPTGSKNLNMIPKNCNIMVQFLYQI